MTSLLVMGMIIAKAANGFPPELVLVSQPVLTYNANSVTVYYDVQNIGDYTYRGDVYVYLDPDNGYYYAKEYVRVSSGRIKRIAIDIPAYRANPNWTYTVMPYYELGDELYSFTVFEYFEPVRFCWYGHHNEPWVVVHVGPRPHYYYRPSEYRFYYDGFRPMVPPPSHGGHGPGDHHMPPMDPAHHTYNYHHNHGGYPANHEHPEHPNHPDHPDHHDPAPTPANPGSSGNSGGSGSFSNTGATVRPSSTPSSMTTHSSNTGNGGGNNGGGTPPTSITSSSSNSGSSSSSSSVRPSSSTSSSSNASVRPSSSSSSNSSSSSGRTGTSSSSVRGSSSSSSSSSGTSSSSSSRSTSNSSSRSSSSSSSSSGRSGSSSGRR